MVSKEKFFANLKTVHPGNYDMGWDDYHLLIEKYPDVSIDLVYGAFKYGFLKGTRAAKKAGAKA